LGINASQAGFRRILIAPQFNHRLNHASGRYNTPQGEVSVEWKVHQGKLDMHVTIPKNSRADFDLPQASNISINGALVSQHGEPLMRAQPPGTYHIKAALKAYKKALTY